MSVHRKPLAAFLACLAFVVLLATPLWAGTIQGGPEADTFFAQAQLRMGYQATYFDFSSDTPNEDGFLNGVYAELEFHEAGWMFKLEGDYYGGSMDFDGNFLGTPVSGSADSTIYHLRALVGYDLMVDSATGVTPYLGLAWRYWESDPGGFGAYKRDTTYLYSPIGVQLTHNDGGPWYYGGQLEYAIFWSGESKNDYSYFDPGFNTVTLSQENGWGMLISAYVGYDFGGWGMTFQPYFEYWNIGDSDKGYVLHNGNPTGIEVTEPSNNTQAYGLRVLVEF